MDSWREYLWVGMGGAMGSVLRFWTSGICARWFGETFPWGTVLVNVSGSFVIGVLFSIAAPDGRWTIGPLARQFLMVGVCGGYTTFSSFSLQTLRLMQERQWMSAGLNVAASVAACLLAVWLGFVVGGILNRSR